MSPDLLLARTVQYWKQALFIIQPETLLRWHREAFRLFWRRKSKAHSHKPKAAAETIALIREMAKENRLWGAERIRGELLKLGIRVCKRTIQKYMRTVRSPQPRGQKWATFVHTHAAQIWACDFLQITDLFFRPLFAFFIIELRSRKVIHVGVTRSPTDSWVAQQLREATPYGQAPKRASGNNLTVFFSGEKVFGRCSMEHSILKVFTEESLVWGYAHSSNTVGGPVDDWGVGLASPPIGKLDHQPRP